jgi:hypothetical protein
MTARVSQRYGCEKSLFGREGLLLFIVGLQNRQQISKSSRKSAKSIVKFIWKILEKICTQMIYSVTMVIGICYNSCCLINN